MFKIHTRDGNTKIVDLKDDLHAKEFLKLLKNREYQTMISGITILKKCGKRAKCPSCKSKIFICENCGKTIEYECQTGVQYSIPRPRGARKVVYIPQIIEPEIKKGNKGGEKLILLYDSNMLIAISHEMQPALRVILSRPGNIRYNPDEDGD